MTGDLESTRPTTPFQDFPARVIVDLTAIQQNTAAIAELAETAAVMAVVKADAYGHGLIPSARAAIRGGATWLGTAQLSEAKALREHGYRGRLLAWLYSPHSSLTEAVASEIDLSVSADWALEKVKLAAIATGTRARIHLKIDTGLSRNGATANDWPALLATVHQAEQEGSIEVVGIWSHFANADMPGHPSITQQLDAFNQACARAQDAGVHATIRHMANSAAALTLPEAHFDMVRAGIAIYGISPFGNKSAPIPLLPAMRVEADLAIVKAIPAGTSVSYGHTYTAQADTTLALVPMGYGDGIPRQASGRGQVHVPGIGRAPIAGRVCMDQFVIDLGPDAHTQPGESVTLFGQGTNGEPTAQEWALAADTIGYEIVTRMAPRVPRQYRGRAATTEPEKW